MPNLDNTGPDGIGPTGRGGGECPNKEKTFSSMLGRGVGRGRSCRGGRGSGRGRGFAQGCRGGYGMGRRRFAGRDEKTFLEDEIKAMEEQVSLMKNRLSEIVK